MTRKTEASSNSASRTASSLRSLRTHIDKLDLQILKLVNERAEPRGRDRQGQERPRHGGLFAGPRRRSFSERPGGQQGPARRGNHSGHLPRDHERLASIAEGAQGRLPRSGVQLTAIWPPSSGLGSRSNSCGLAASPRSSRRSTAAMPTSASCRWRTPPTAGSPTRWRCSCACRS